MSVSQMLMLYVYGPPGTPIYRKTELEYNRRMAAGLGELVPLVMIVSFPRNGLS